MTYLQAGLLYDNLIGDISMLSDVKAWAKGFRICLSAHHIKEHFDITIIIYG